MPLSPLRQKQIESLRTVLFTRMPVLRHRLDALGQEDLTVYGYSEEDAIEDLSRWNKMSRIYDRCLTRLYGEGDEVFVVRL